jgi:hypothetical protein
MTREQKEQACDQILHRYEDLGATIVADDYSLRHLLATLEFDRSDHEVGEYLCSFLSG